MKLYVTLFLMNNLKNSIFTWILRISVPAIFLILFEVVISTKQEAIRIDLVKSTSEFATTLIAEINKELTPLVYATNGLEAYIKVTKNKADSADIQGILKEIKEYSPIIRNIAISKGTVITYCYPIKGNEAIINVDYKNVPDQWPLIKKIIRTHESILAGPVDLIQGGRAIIFRKPIFADNKFWGISSTVIDVNSLFEKALSKLSIENYKFAVRLSSNKQGKHKLYGDEKIFANPESFIVIDKIPNGKWEYAILPTYEGTNYNLLNTLRWLGRLGTLVLFFIVFFITGLRRKIVKSEARYRLLAQNLSNIIWLSETKECKITYISPSVKELLGYEISELINVDYSEILTNKKVKEQIVQFINDFPKKKTLKLEYTLKDKNKLTIWVETEFKLIKFRKKSDYHLLGNTQIIHRRKLIENKLRNNEEQLRAIINTTLIGVAIINPNGNIVYANPNSKVIHAYSNNEIVGKDFYKIVHRNDKETIVKQLNGLIEKKYNSVDVDVRILTKNKKTVWIHISANLYPEVLSVSGDNILLLYQDISKQKSDENKLKELNDTKDRFISVLAHDLKSPFSGFLGYLEYISAQQETLSKEQILNLISTLNSSAQNTYILLENLLMWANTQRNKISFKPVNTNLRIVAQDTLSLVQYALTEKKIKSVNYISTNLLVYADIQMLRTIFRNLISNAVKYCNENGTIEVNAEPEGKDIKISISDDGIGMSKEVTENLFSLKQNKSHKGTKGETGTGFGLIISKEFVEKHGGKIWVESEEGKGSSFIFTFPASSDYLTTHQMT